MVLRLRQDFSTLDGFEEVFAGGFQLLEFQVAVRGDGVEVELLKPPKMISRVLNLSRNLHLNLGCFR